MVNLCFIPGINHHNLYFHFRTWWRHQMETFSTLLALCVGNSPVNSPHKGQWCGAMMFSLIYAWINGWVNNCEAGDLRRHHAHYGVTVMTTFDSISTSYDISQYNSWNIITEINRFLLLLMISDYKYAVINTDTWMTLRIQLSNSLHIKDTIH